MRPNKVKVYFPNNEETIKDQEVHAVSYHDDPRTFCGMVWDEWHCGYDFESNVTDSAVTCKGCIKEIEEAHNFVKTKTGWK